MCAFHTEPVQQGVGVNWLSEPLEFIALSATDLQQPNASTS